MCAHEVTLSAAPGNISRKYTLIKSNAVIIGFACAGIQVAALPAMATTYSVDSYKPVAGSLMVAITVNKNLWGYGFAEFIIPWILKSGFIPPIM